MANNREAIRAALVTMLSGQTDAGTNVYPSRGSKYWESELPAIAIYTNQETSQPAHLRGTRYNRTLELTIEVRIVADTAVDDSVDELLADIEGLIEAEPSIGGTVQAAILTGTELRIDEESERKVGVGVLTYECKYSS